MVASRTSPTEDLACNPGMWPDWELNLQPFVSKACTQSTELRQPRLKDFIYFIFRERGRVGEGERERGKHPSVVASYVPPTGDLARNTGTCPDWESNALQNNTEPTELYRSGLSNVYQFTLVLYINTQSGHMLLAHGI